MRDAKAKRQTDAGRSFRAIDISVIAMLLALVLVVGLIERLLPLDFIVPGARLGISNIVVVISLYIFPKRVTLLVVVLKCLLLSALTGGFSTFMYSFAGSILALGAMLLLLAIAGERVSPVGVSTVGAVFHSIGQVSMAAIIIENAAMYLYLPLLIIISIASGILVGILTKLLIPRVSHIRERSKR